MSALMLAAAEGAEKLPEGAVLLQELTTEHNIAWVIIDVVIILLVARLVGAGFRRIGQPPVVGEILAGLIMGPLVLGSGTITELFNLDEPISTTLFPIESRPFLKVLAELGLVIFMFVVGLELDMKLIKGKERLAAGVSLTSVLLPFSLGFGLAALLKETYLPEDIEFLPFALFIGASMSVTAFPVLARILNERRMQGTAVGAVTLACAAIDDILAWSLLALVTAVIESTTGGDGGSPAVHLLRVMGLTIAFGIFMSVAVRPVLVKLNERFKAHGLTPDVLAAVLGILLIASWCTSNIGIHSIFGAFMLGVVFPREGAEEFTHKILERVESVAVLLLLPLFFIVTGLNAKVGKVSIGEFAKVLAAVVVVACVGKFLGATLAGRFQGMSWRRSAAIGTLMNTRGLTELVLLSIGRDKGVLNDTLFTALVLMAIITTVMTSPLLKKIYPDRMIEHDIAEAERARLGDAIAFRVLVAIDDPARAEPLVDMACGIAAAQQPAEVVLTSFEQQQESTGGREISSFLDTIASELDVLHDLGERVRARGLSVQTFSQRTTSLAADIAAQAKRMGARLVLVGDRRDDPAWVATVAELVAAAPADVGVVVAPLPRAGVAAASGAPVVEVGEGPSAMAALEYGVRLALPTSVGPTIVGLVDGTRGARRYRGVLGRLAELGRPGRSEGATLDTVEGATAAAGAVAVVRPFASPEGLQPVERARPDAERFGCPVLLVAPDPNQIERSGLDTLLSETEPLAAAEAESRPAPVD